MDILPVGSITVLYLHKYPLEHIILFLFNWFALMVYHYRLNFRFVISDIIGTMNA